MRKPLINPLASKVFLHTVPTRRGGICFGSGRKPESGKFVQHRSGALRISVRGYVTALALGETLHLPVARGNQSVDLWLEKGTHDLTIFAATDSSSKAMEATIARATLDSAQLRMGPFSENDFNLKSAPSNPAEISESIALIELSPTDAVLEKETEKFGGRLSEENPILGDWASNQDLAKWTIEIPDPGVY